MPVNASIELDDVLTKRLAELDAQQLRRQPVEVARGQGVQLVRGGQELVSFSCNDYLGLSHHPAVIEAACEATQRYGTGAGASRLVTGEHPLYATLEAQLAGHHGTQAACVFGSGYLANIGTIAALVGKGDLVLGDKLIHACMVDGAQLSGASFKRFAHLELAHLERLLQQHRADYRHCLLLSEQVFSMDGDCAPLDEMQALAERYDAWLMVDGAHELAPMGAVDVKMGTLSKAVGAYGGYVCGSRALVDYLKNTARSLVFTTGLPPGVLAAASAALEVMRAQPELAEMTLQQAQLFTRLMGLPAAQSAIVPLVIGEAQAALDASATLREAGFMVSAIRPPTVPQGTARLRFAFSALHTDAEIERLAEVVKAIADKKRA